MSTAYFHHNFASIGDKTHCYDVSLPHFTFLLPILTMFLKRESRLELNIFYTQAASKVKGCGGGEEENLSENLSFFSTNFLLYAILISLKFNYREDFRKILSRKLKILGILFWTLTYKENETLENPESLKFYPNLETAKFPKNSKLLPSFKNSKLSKENTKKKISKFPRLYKILLLALTLKIQREYWKYSSPQISSKSTYP